MSAGATTLEVPCPNCHKVLMIPVQYAGKTGRCNACGGAVLVPMLSPKLPRAVPEVAEETPKNITTQTVTATNSTQVTRGGPFGLRMGMTLEDIGEESEVLGQGVYKFKTLAKGHPAFKSYIVTVTPRFGLSWIKGMGNNIQTNGFGHQLISEFNSMEMRLTAVYGIGKRSDYLLDGSTWDEAQYWMSAVKYKERTLMTIWSEENGLSLGNDLTMIGLLAYAIDSETGFLTLEYYFRNNDAAEAEIAEAEDEVL
jgi:hypothetical protein